MTDDGAGGDDWRVIAGLQLRRGTDAHADIAAELYLRARHHAVPEVPALVHSDNEVRQWLHGVLQQQEVWLARAGCSALFWPTPLTGRVDQKGGPADVSIELPA